MPSEFRIPASFRVSNGEDEHPGLAAVVNSVVQLCIEAEGHFDLNWLHGVLLIARDPAAPSESLSVLSPDAGRSLEALAVQAKNNPELRPLPGAILLALEGVRLRDNLPPWGGCVSEYPGAVAYEVTGHRESVFHECLHIFGVSEGYDTDSRTTRPGCESCWMQWQATHGSGLCDAHRTELRDFMLSL